eukprot:TRINITY_DN20947_c0_g1_i1.p2 TRINITY_DN20947_c0_g1~~TRINITY_DN20947_c0_g1_i1.p2  ORF type:complete len:223 (+),score=61.55 TRINITY_DN20947_c0_g1_i1:93-761(+)
MALSQWTLSPVAYGKVFLHAQNYPSQAVSGLLLGRVVTVEGKKELFVAEVLPLFHSFVQLLPMLQVALAHARTWGKDRGLTVVGYYTAPSNLNDKASITPFAEKAMKLVSEANAGNPSLALAIINSKMTGDSAEIPFKFFDSSDLKTGRTSESGCCRFGYLHEDSTVVALPDQQSTLERVASLIQEGGAHIVDFESHLDNVSLDYTNSKLSSSLSSGIVPQA